jgi:diketogulonate reductase-like aldo/keto reductase/cyclophilin family peptidyl-prolyl cis-trans isomerase
MMDWLIVHLVIFSAITAATTTQYTVVFDFEIYGTVRMVTVPQAAFPRATATFLGNIRRRYYDHCVLYRSEFFVLQGGECTNWDENDRPPHVLHTKQPIALSPPEWNKAFPHIEGSVALAGVPASMHFFINLIDRTEWSNSFEDGVRSEPTIAHVIPEDMHIIRAIRSTTTTTNEHPQWGKVNDMNFLNPAIRIRRAFVLEDEMVKATQTFLMTLTTEVGSIVMRTIPSNKKTVDLFLHNCRSYYASPPGGCSFYRAEKDSLLMAGECQKGHILPTGPEVRPPQFDSKWENVMGTVTVTGEEAANEYFFINVNNNSQWIRRAVVATVEKGWNVIQQMVGMPTQRTHPKLGHDLKMSFLQTPIRILGCNVVPSRIPVCSLVKSTLSEHRDIVMHPMIYRRLGRTNLQVSILGLGTHSFGDLDRVGTVEHAVLLMRNAFRLGINVIDTADCYPCTSVGCVGKLSETVIGQALKRLELEDENFDRDNIVIMTKMYDDRSGKPNTRGLSKKHIVRGCHQSLARLQLTYIDVLFAHADDFSIPMVSIVQSFGHLVRKGLILHWAVSNWKLERIALAIEIAQKLSLPPPMVDQSFYDSTHADDPTKHSYAQRQSLLETHDIGKVIFGALDNTDVVKSHAVNMGISERSVAKAMSLQHGTIVLIAPSRVSSLVETVREVLQFLNT